MDAHDPDPPKLYPLKRSEAELRRLSLQDELIGESTLALFERAGITKGMRVLDVGSGAGDVAFAVAGLVGPAGSVVGVELDTPSAETARRRAEDAGIGNVEFLSGDVATLELPGPFDAAVGRYRYLEETARGLLGMWKRVGAEGADDIELEGMAERIEREVGAEGSVLIHTMVGAWAPAP